MIRPPTPMRGILESYRAAYAGLPPAVWWLCGAMLINRAGTMVLPFLTLYFTRELGFDVGDAGLLFSAYGVGAMVGSYGGGEAADRYGALRVQVVSLTATGLGFALLEQLRTPAVIAAMLFFVSALGESFRPANASLLAAASPPESLTRAVALNRLAINLGMAIGPSAGGLLAGLDYSLLFWVDGGTCLAAAVFLVGLRSVLRAPATEAQDGPSAARGTSPWRDGPFLVCVLLFTLSAIVFLQLLSTVPLYYKNVWGFPEEMIGMLLALNPILIVLFEMVLVHRLSRPNPLRLIALGTLLCGLGLGMMPLGSGVAFALLTIVVWTAGEMLDQPFMGGFVAGRGGPASRGRYLGVYQLSFSVALVVSPVVGTAVYDGLGPRVLWYGCAVCGALIALGYVAVGRAVD